MGVFGFVCCWLGVFGFWVVVLCFGCWFLGCLFWFWFWFVGFFFCGLRVCLCGWLVVCEIFVCFVWFLWYGVWLVGLCVFVVILVFVFGCLFFVVFFVFFFVWGGCWVVSFFWVCCVCFGLCVWVFLVFDFGVIDCGVVVCGVLLCVWGFFMVGWWGWLGGLCWCFGLYGVLVL